MFKSSWEWLLLILGFFYWATVGLLITFLGITLSILLSRQNALKSGRFLLSKAFKFFISFLRITGLLILDDSELKKIANIDGAVIIAPNHIALWDAVFIIASLPEVVCIMKGEILRNPFLGGGAQLAGYIPDDSISIMFKRAIQCLDAQEKILLFSEGTRTKNDAKWINPIKSGVALLARKAQVPVLPVFIRSNTRFFEKGWPLYKKPVFPLHISFTVGDCVYMKADESTRAFNIRLENMYINELSRPHPLIRI